MKKVIIYTDGACSGNPGPGGWAAIMKYKDFEKIVTGGEKNTTNNKMELLAAINSLKILKGQCEVDMYTDSNYVKKGVTEWMPEWIKRDWKNSKKKEIKNIELWQELEKFVKNHNITWHWVKAHSGNELNERADALAVKERNKHM